MYDFIICIRTKSIADNELAYEIKVFIKKLINKEFSFKKFVLDVVKKLLKSRYEKEEYIIFRERS